MPHPAFSGTRCEEALVPAGVAVPWTISRDGGRIAKEGSEKVSAGNVHLHGLTALMVRRCLFFVVYKGFKVSSCWDAFKNPYLA